MYMNNQVKQHLEVILDDSWAYFLADFQDNHEFYADHAFRSLVALDNFLNETDRSPESYVS